MILKPVYGATLRLSGDYVPLSTAAYNIYPLRKIVQQGMLCEQAWRYKDLRESIYGNIRTRFLDRISGRSLVSLACVFDPRTRDLETSVQFGEDNNERRA